MNSTAERLWVLGALIVSSAVLLALSFRYMPFIADDALISLRYAERLIEGKGLTWNDGPRVEGYSNLLWILAMALGGRFGFDLIQVARATGLAAFIVLFALFVRQGVRFPGRTPLPGLCAALAIATSSVSAVWAIGGLEQPFVALFIGWSLVVISPVLETDVDRKTVWMRGIPLGLLCLTRPDGPLFAVVAGAVLLGWRGFRTALMVVLPSVAAVAGQLLFRLGYYRDWLPNTAYIKVSFCTERLTQGLDYLSKGVEGLSPVLVLSTVGIAAAIFGHLRRSAVTALSMMLVWAAYVVFIGGDIFPGYRHFTPIQVSAAFLVLIGFDWIASRVEARGRVWASLVVATLVAVSLQVKLQYSNPEFIRAVAERWEWDGKVVGTLFGTGFRKEQPLLAVTAAGCIPYFSKLPALDLLGLNDRHVARTHPKKVGYLAHDHGDGKYTLDLKPDIILMNVQGGKLQFRSGQQMLRDQRFHRHYRPVAFEGFTPHRVRTIPFVRIDGRIGIRREKDRIVHPGYLFRGAGVTGVLNDKGIMTSQLPAKGVYTSLPITVPAGRWRFDTIPTNPDLSLEPVETCGAAVEGSVLRLTSPCEVTFRVSPKAHALLRELWLERVSSDGEK